MKLTKEQIINEVKNSSNPKVKVAITDLDGVLRGKYLHKNKFLSAIEGGFGFCDVIFGWDINDLAIDGMDFTGWHTGYPDANATLDLNTFRKVPWDNDVPFFLGDFNIDICPRNLLKKIKDETIKLGFQPFFGQEFEWFNFRETSESLHEKNFNNPKPLTEGMFGYSILRMAKNKEFLNDIYDLMFKFNVPIEGLHTETGPGVLEAAILYGDVLESADRAVLFKSGVKEIGLRYGIMPTFMAKINEKLPGCSGHIHQSLRNEKENVFYDDKSKTKMSPLMESYIAGLLHCMPFVLPMYAPTINSFKRLVEGAWAPTTVTWGIDNRTTCVRALLAGSQSTRIELRVVGSDANPYLAHAAALASGLYGIKNKMKLDVAMTEGSGYRDLKNGCLPRNLWDATQAMKSSSVAKEIFGEKFVKHFTDTREWEWKQHAKAVTDWEFKRYFEIV
ncbi:MAG: glutamine synthetase [Bacteriovorax sp.]|nr:glutamine synthetase [Bacteriovorax sp.]